ncbi:diguanylate cyclase domain-containing protein [Aquabacter spiritensis]|uniref:diguanylate cyclase domain-containing protein n=1 Tax=Aquabacter spiritensis TaxID=933073 RepID=UPI0010541133|nr:diguanylate cyclase [Aquabacter spiritensis]
MRTQFACLLDSVRLQFDAARVALLLPDGEACWSMAPALGDAAAGVRDLLARPIADGAPVQADDIRVVEGETVWRFFAGVPLFDADGGALGTLALFSPAPRRLDAAQADRLAAFARIFATLILESRRARALAQIGSELAAARDLARENGAAVERFRKMYERSSALAKIGTWECDLATGALTWTDGVYDIFELPRGSYVTREMILELYYAQSRRQMERMRSKAIADCTSFVLDVRVRTARGNRRWVRLSIDVEADAGRAVRIFGTKQDVTQEKELLERMRRLAEFDMLTGLANRAMFETELQRALRAPRGRAFQALVLIDLDGFKSVNDTFGHAAGDACLKEVARRLRGVFKGRRIGRIGGDEFAVLVGGARATAGLDHQVKCALDAIERPVAWAGRTFSVGASAGIARPFGDDPLNLTQIFAEADAAMYAAKKRRRILADANPPDGWVPSAGR